MAHEYGQGTSSSMSRETNINLIGGPQDRHFVHRSVSQYAPKMWETKRPAFREWRDFAPITSSPALDNVVSWKVSPQGNLLSHVELIWAVSAVATTGSGTYYRLDDYAGIAGIEQVTISYGTKEIARYPGEFIHHMHRLEHDERQADAYTETVAGDLTESARNTAAASAQRFLVTLPLPWNLNEFDENARKLLPIATLANDLTFDIEFRASSEFVQHDYTTAVVTMSGTPYLRCHFVHIRNDEHNALNALTLRPGGLPYKITSLERQANEAVASGSTSATIKLPNLKNPFYNLFFTFRKASDIAAGSLWEHEAVTSWKLMDSGKDITPTFYDRYNRFKTKPRHHKGRVGDYIYTIPIGEVPSDHDSGHGHMNPQQMNNLELVLTFSSISEAYRVDVYAMTHNILQIEAGDMVRNFR